MNVCMECGKELQIGDRIVWRCEDCARKQMEEYDNKCQRIAELEEQLKNAIVLPCIKKHTTYLDVDSGLVEIAWYVIYKQKGFGDEIFTIKCRSEESAKKELEELRGKDVKD